MNVSIRKSQDSSRRRSTFGLIGQRVEIGADDDGGEVLVGPHPSRGRGRAKGRPRGRRPTGAQGTALRAAVKMY